MTLHTRPLLLALAVLTALCLALRLVLPAEQWGVLAMAALAVILAGTVTAVLIGRSRSRRLAQMVEATRSIAQGAHGQRLPGSPRDDVGELALSMNRMLDNLQEARLELEALNRDLEERVVQRTAELEREVVERRRSERALQRANLRFSLAAAAVEGAIYDYEVAAGRIEWTDGLERVFGYPVAEVPRSPEWRVKRIHPDDVERFRKQLNDDIEAGRDFLCEYRFRAKNGEYLDVWDRARAIQDGDRRTVRLVGVIENVSELRALESQVFHAQRMEAVGRLAGGVAHDFNNLLTTILGYCDLLLHQEPSDDEWTVRVEEIRRASERAASLTGQLLAFSRRQVIHPRLLDLNAVVRELESMLAPVIGEAIRVDFRPQAQPAVVLADRGQIEQVLMNLAVNARDAMPRGGTMKVRTGEREIDEAFVQSNRGAVPGHYCFLEISDTGVGMDSATLAKVFEPFFTTKEVGSGTGLGMSIVYGIVKQSNGYVKVESAPGKGTRVTVLLPRQEGSPAPEERPLATGAVPGGTENVLLVEDEDALRQMIQTVLSARGYRVTAAESPAEALDLMRELAGRVDLVISDVVMPGMSGREMLNLMRREWPDLPVLFVSGYAGETVLAHGVSGEQLAFLAKPFTLEELLERVRLTLDEQAAPAN